MKIKLLVSRAAAAGTQNAGDEIDVPDDEAIRMIDAGQCVPVRAAAVETAVKRTKAEIA